MSENDALRLRLALRLIVAVTGWDYDTPDAALRALLEIRTLAQKALRGDTPDPEEEAACPKH